MRVVLADDAGEVRSAVRLLLEEELRAEIVGEVETEDDLAEVLIAARPDLLLLDWELVARRDPASVARLREAAAGAGIIALSGRPESRRAALATGIDGFASKGDGPEHLVHVVRSVVNRRGMEAKEEEA